MQIFFISYGVMNINDQRCTDAIGANLPGAVGAIDGRSMVAVHP